ncbi:hypothetical protein ACOMHN_004308 [Nucella lapillus]
MDAVPPAQTVSYVDGKCACCPYGYHIDLDFLDFCQDVTHGSDLSNLKRIQRAKRKLRKSMEVMLHQQQNPPHGDSATATLASTPPPDVVHSTEASRLINMVQYEQTATHQVLRHIDSSVNAALAGGKAPPQRTQRYTSSDSDEGYMYAPVSPPDPHSPPLYSPPQHHAPPSPRRSTHHHHHHHHHHPSNGDESSHFATSLSTSGRTDSMSSLSSVSTVSSEQVTGQYTAHASGMLNAQPHETATAQIRIRSQPRHHTTSATAMTVEKLAATMATHFPRGDRLDGGESPSSPISPEATISKASLAAIRETMAVSLQRMRDLEEQVKAIPILQVRISVLKEEKRLLALQLKAKSTTASVRSIGVGEESVYAPLSVSTSFPYPTPSSPFTPLATASPRSPLGRVRTVGVGEHNVVEPYLLQPHLPTGYTLHDNVVQTEIHSKESISRMMQRQQHPLPGLAVSTDRHTATSPRGGETTHFTINQIQRSSPRPLTRSLGVGEGNVHDGSLQIHEKELRTVIIGGAGAGKRNVGVEVRVPTRSVGVMYACEDARPATRTVGVNVNYDTSGILTTLDFKGESQLRTALRGVLQRSVRSAATQCGLQAAVTHRGVQHEAFSGVSVGPEVSSRAVSTSRDWVQDQATNTVRAEAYNKACSTEARRLATVATNTPSLLHRQTATQTECQVFHSLQMIKTIGVNTTPTPTAHRASNTLTVPTASRSVNTKAPQLSVENFDVDISFADKGVNTSRRFADTGVNTNTRELRLAVTKVESIDVAGEEVEGEGGAAPSPKRPLTMQEHILQRGASQASAFLGSTSSSGSLSPTSPLTEDASVSRTVRETVHTSPASFRHVWTGQGYPQQPHDALSGGESGVTDGGVGGVGYSRSTVTETTTTSTGGEGDRITADGRSFGDAGYSGGGGGGSYKSTITRTVSGGNDGDMTTAGGGNRSTITRTVTSGGGGEEEGDDDTYSSGSSNVRRSVVTKTITTRGRSGARGRLTHSEDADDDSGVSRRTITTHEGSMGGGGFSSGGGGEGMQKSTYTKTFISTGGIGGGLNTAGSGQESYNTKTISDGGGGGDTGSGFSSSSSSTVTKMISGDVRREGGSDGAGSAIRTAEGSGDRSSFSETLTHSGSPGRVSSHSPSIKTKTITIHRTLRGSSPSRTTLTTESSQSGGSGRSHSYGESKSIDSRDVPEGGTGYLERFGYARNASNLASPGAESLQVQQTTESSMETSAESQNSDMTSGGFQTSGYSSGEGEGGGVEVVEGRAVLQSAVSEPSFQGGQVTLVGGSASGQEGSASGEFSSGSLQDVTSGGQMTETVVVKRSSSGGQQSRHRHSDGARLSGEMDAPGVFSGRRVGSVEDFMPDSVRRFMNIESTGGGGSKSSKARSGGGKADRLVTKTVKTVTTKRSTRDGKSVVSVTKTVTNPDGSVTTFTEDTDDPEASPSLGHLTLAQLDLSTVGGASGSQDSSESQNPEDLDMSGLGTLERKELKSIMKRSRSEDAAKKGISFADSVVGGTGSSSEGDASDDESSTSYDEGSYDGRRGDITHQCGDDEAIARGLPGAAMYDQSIRQTSIDAMRQAQGRYELSVEMRQACQVLADYLVDSTTIQTKQLVSTSLPLSVPLSVPPSVYLVDSTTIQTKQLVSTSLPLSVPLSVPPSDYLVDSTTIQTKQLVSTSLPLSVPLSVPPSDYLVDSTTIQTKQLNTNLSIVQGEWFRVSSHKLSSPHQVEDYLSSINEISPRLLDYIVNMVDNNGNAAIHYCVSHCNFDIVGLLLDTDVCDVRRPNKGGYSPAMLASLAHVQNEDHRRIILRLFAVSDINARAEQTGQTALMLATSQCRADMVQLLLEAGADVNMQDHDGSTALMCASEHGHAAIAQLLLARADCDANMTDHESSTALSIAMEAGHKDMGVILYKHLNFSAKTASPNRYTRLTTSEDPRVSAAATKGRHSRDRSVTSGGRHSRVIAAHSRCPSSSATATARCVQACVPQHSSHSSVSAASPSKAFHVFTVPPQTLGE